MGHPADIGLINPHAKGHSGNHNQPVILLKAQLGLTAVFGVHSSVIVQHQMPRPAQGLGQNLCLGAAGTVDDPRLPFTRCRIVQNLLARAVFDGKGQPYIGPVKAAQKGDGGRAVEQTGCDLGPRFGIGRGGKGRQRHAQRLPQSADAQVIGAKVVAPLADTMRLVHGNQAHPDAPQHGHRGGGCKPFGGQIKQLQSAFIKGCEDLFRLLLGIARCQRPRFNPSSLKRAHLIAHQGNQWRDHHCHPITAQRRQLKTQRFAAARGHDGQGVLPCDHRLNNLFLTGAKPGKAPNLVQQLVRRGHSIRMEHMGRLIPST